MRRRFSGLLMKCSVRILCKPVGKLDQQHPDVVGNREQEFAQILGRALIFGLRFDLRQLGHAVDQDGDFRSEFGLDIFNRGQRVLNRVVEQRGDDRVLIHFQVGHQTRNLDRVAEIRVA